MKTRITMITALVLIVALLAVSVSFASQPRLFVSFPGGPGVGSTLMDTAAATVGFLNLAFADRINFTPEASAGGPDNITRVSLGEVEMASAMSADIHEAFRGIGFFEGNPLPNIRGVGFFTRAITHAVTLRGSGITSVEDFAGRRIGVGGHGSGAATLHERLFTSLGMWDQINPQFLSGADQAAAIRDGHIDVLMWSMGVPGALVMDIAASRDIELIDVVTPAKAAGFFDDFPALQTFTISSGSYRDVGYDVPAIANMVFWIANKDFCPDLLYELMEAVYSEEGLEHLQNTFAPLRDMREADGTQGFTIPLHVGAERFWRNRGIEIREEIRAID